MADRSPVRQEGLRLVPGRSAPPADGAERDLALRSPRDQALLGFAFWVAAAVIFAALITVRDGLSTSTWRVAVGITLGGLSTCALVYLLVERALRPEFAVVLAGRGVPRSPTSAGIRPRLLITWALCSGIPFVVLGLASIGLDQSSRAVLASRLWVFVVIGVGAGSLATWVAARSVADPLESIRDAMRRVRGRRPQRRGRRR